MKIDPLEIPDAVTFLTPEQIIAGPSIDPVLRVQLYSPEQFEGLIREWAFHYLQRRQQTYCQVSRIGGSGDLGRDVIGYSRFPPQGEDFDVYQCKHYDHPIQPNELWVELGKLCYHTFTGAILVPRTYKIVAPQDVGPGVAELLEAPLTIAAKLLDQWSTYCETKINRPHGVPLSNELRQHILDFDFSIVATKPIHEVIEELRLTPCFAPRFGGGLQHPPPDEPSPPENIQPNESRYVEQLVEAYRDETNDSELDLESLIRHEELDRHFSRSRERFYCAESLERFARDALVGGQGFSDLKDQVFNAVVDVSETDHPSGFKRVLAVTDLPP